MYWPLH